MALGSYVQQSSCVNFLANPTREQYKLAGQDPVKKFNVGSNEAPTKALTPPKAPTPPLISLSTKNFFIKLMKILMETM